MKLIALDIETTGLNPRKDKLHGIGIAHYDEFGKIVKDYLPADSEKLKRYLANPDKHIVGHNVRFDLKFLICNGYTINCRVWDTKLLAQLIDENQRLGLKDLAENTFGANALLNKKDLDRAISYINGRSVADLCAYDLADPDKLHYDTIAAYCMEDCENTLKLFTSMWEEIKRRDTVMKNKGFAMTPRDYYEQETLPLEPVLMDMELRGIKLDVDGLTQFREQVINENKRLVAHMSLLAAKEIAAIEEELYEKQKAKKKTEVGKKNVQKKSDKHKTKFNWQSSEHLADLIFKKFGVPTTRVEKTETGKPSTSESALETLHATLPDENLLKKVLGEYKKWKKNVKLVTTYTGDEEKGILSQVEDGRIYAEYLQAGRGKEGKQAMMGGTVTGRLSSRNPNLQNLPRGSEIKKFFRPDEGQVFVYFDYSQLELRLAAHLSQDKLLIQAYNDNLDLHQITAEAIGADRQVGKAVNFAMIYDASAYRLSSMVNKSVEECKHIIQEFFKLYYGYKNYLWMQRKFMEKNRGVLSETGRFRNLPELFTEELYSKGWRHALKQGYNFPIQSLGASITKRAMIELHRRNHKIITTIHDSVIVTVDADQAFEKAKEIQQIAETVYPLTVPLKADVKLLTSLSESDIITKQEETNEQHRNNSPVEGIR